MILDEYLAARSITAEVQTTTATVDCAVYRTDRHVSMNLFCTTSVEDHDEEKRTEFICTQQ